MSSYRTSYVIYFFAIVIRVILPHSFLGILIVITKNGILRMGCIPLIWDPYGAICLHTDIVSW